jgi:hypothetical protein
MPIETEINIPQAAFEVTPRAFSEMPNTEIRSFLLMKKTEQLLEFQKQSVIAGYYQRFHFLRIQLYRAGSKCLGNKPSDGVLD